MEVKGIGIRRTGISTMCPLVERRDKDDLDRCISDVDSFFALHLDESVGRLMFLQTRSSNCFTSARPSLNDIVFDARHERTIGPILEQMQIAQTNTPGHRSEEL